MEDVGALISSNLSAAVEYVSTYYRDYRYFGQRLPIVASIALVSYVFLLLFFGKFRAKWLFHCSLLFLGLGLSYLGIWFETDQAYVHPYVSLVLIVLGVIFLVWSLILGFIYSSRDPVKTDSQTDVSPSPAQSHTIRSSRLRQRRTQLKRPRQPKWHESPKLLES